MSVCIMCGTNLSGDEQCGTCPQCSELRNEVVRRRKWHRCLVHFGFGIAVLAVFLSVFVESILVLWWGVLMGILLAFIFFVGMPDTIEEEVKKELEERRAKDQE
jgi:predicted nucleic acid-binding Zn ribbon protein